MSDEVAWYYLDGFNQAKGPVTLEFVVTLIREYGDLPVCCKGMADWAPAMSLGEFADCFPQEVPAEQKEAARGGHFAKAFIQTRNLDELLGLCKGLLADGRVVEREAIALEEWSRGNKEIAEAWPASVLSQRLRGIFEDGVVTEEELEELRHLLEKIVGGPPDASLVHRYASNLPLDDPAPHVVIPNRAFCFTGKFVFGTRRVCEAAVSLRGGRPKANVYPETDYLVIGTFATQAWVHGSHGRKVEEALRLRQEGAPIRLICEEHWTRFLA